MLLRLGVRRGYPGARFCFFLQLLEFIFRVTNSNGGIVWYLQKLRNSLLNSFVYWYNIPYLTHTSNAKRYHTGDVNDDVRPTFGSCTGRLGIAPNGSLANGGGPCESSVFGVFVRIVRIADGGSRLVTIIER